MLFLHGFRHWTKKQTITVVRAMKVPEQVGKLVRPERFELPTYCSGVILGHLGPNGRELQPVGNTN
jgi:hypothetical protein